jgi:signal transduction histidine kinase
LFRALAFGATCVLLGLQWVATSRAFGAYVEHLSAIYENSLPSIEEGSAIVDDIIDLRRDLRRLEADRASPAEWRECEAEARVRLADARRQMETDETTSLTWPGERALQRERRATLERLEVDVRALFQASGAEARLEALAELRGSIDVAARAANSLVRFNAHNAALTARSVYAAEESAVSSTRIMTITFLVLAAVFWVVWERHTGRLEREREETLAELDAFAGRIAHDLRGPLASIALGMEMIRREGGERLDARTLGSIDRVATAVAGMTGLIEGLLAFARAGGSPDPGAASEVEPSVRRVTSTLEPRVDAARARLVLEVEPGLHVRAQKGVLESILENLASNALLHMGDSPERTIVVRANTVDDGATVVLEVADTGPGIPDDVQKRLFRPFQRGTTSVPGHGLGLATVKRLAEGHGGRVELVSHVGAGSTFRVFLPAASPRAVRPSGA